MVKPLRLCARPRARGGFSLAETLVAFTLLGVGVLSLGAAAATAAGTLREASLAQGAVLEAAVVLDSLADAPRAGRDSVTRGPFTLVWTAVDSAGSVLIELDVHWSAGGPPRQLRLGRRAVRMPRRAVHAP